MNNSDRIDNKRPCIIRSHTRGNVQIRADRGVELICGGKNILSSDVPLKEAMANAELFKLAPTLLDIAEMYFDSMKGTRAENGLAYKHVLDTLNKLKN